MLGESQSGCLMCARVSEASFLSSETSAGVFFSFSFSFERDRNKRSLSKRTVWCLLGSFFMSFTPLPPPQLLSASGGGPLLRELQVNSSGAHFLCSLLFLLWHR